MARRRKKQSASSHKLSGLIPLAMTLTTARVNPVRKDQPSIATRARVTHGAQPAKLVIAEAAPVVGGHAGFDHLCGERNAISGLEDALAQFIVVGKIIDECFESADLLECIAADGERGAEAVAQAALDHAGNQNARHEVGGDAERLEPRAERAMRAAAIESRHEADRFGRLRTLLCRRRREMSHHAFKVARAYGDVGVVDEHIFVAGVRQRAGRAC